ncbi:MAG: hypothetical protein ABSG03_11235, partial [Bryobacteraceae bacterium]
MQRRGLKLEARKAPVDVVVVDHVERIPTENQAGIDARQASRAPPRLAFWPHRPYPPSHRRRVGRTQRRLSTGYQRR